MKTRALFAAIVFCVSGAAFAANVKKSFRTDHKFTLAAGGSLVLENPVGNIEISGTDNPGITATAIKTVIGPDAAAIAEGDQQTALVVGGDDKTRVLRTVVALNPARRWTSSVFWNLKVPRSAYLRIVSNSSDRIRIQDMRGRIVVKNFNGRVVLAETQGPVNVESVNGSILYAVRRPKGNVVLSTVNGDVTASVDPAADVQWAAETIKGEIKTNLPVRGAFFDRTFRGSLNAPGGPSLNTGSLMGNIQFLGLGMSVSTAQSLRATAAQSDIRMASSSGKPAAGSVAVPSFKGLFQYATNIGDVRVQEIKGDADVFTGAGEVQLGSVSGNCRVRSQGGPLQLGEILGVLAATTRAGDILVDSARRGGTIGTRGGTIRLLYTSGPTRLVSGGGDIVVRQAAGAIDAQTESGDITISVDPAAKSQKLTAKSAKGNIVVNVSPRFGADVEATITTSDPQANTITSEIPGLSIRRQQVNGKTVVKATGKINGGGEKVVLQVTDGDIRITAAPPAPTVVQRH